MLRLRKQQDSPTRPGCFHSGPNKAVACHSQYDGVSPPAFRQFLDRRDGVRGGGVDVLVETKRLCNCKPLRKQIGSNNSHPTLTSQYRQNDTDRPLANYQNGLARIKSQRLYAFHAGVDRLDKGSLLERYLAGNADHAAAADDPIHYPDVLRKASATRLIARRCANLLVRRALRKNLVFAVVTATAW